LGDYLIYPVDDWFGDRYGAEYDGAMEQEEVDQSLVVSH
jgi:hypothetical protein